MTTKNDLIHELIAALGVFCTAVNVWDGHWGMAVLTGGFALLVAIETAATRIVRAIERGTAPVKAHLVYTSGETR